MSCSNIVAGTFLGADIEPGVFHGADIEPGVFHHFGPMFERLEREYAERTASQAAASSALQPPTTVDETETSEGVPAVAYS